MVFVDEFGFNLRLSRTRGRAHRGERAVRVVNGQRGRNFTLILAVSTEGVRHTDFYEGEVTADRFNTWSTLPVTDGQIKRICWKATPSASYLRIRLS